MGSLFKERLHLLDLPVGLVELDLRRDQVSPGIPGYQDLGLVALSFVEAEGGDVVLVELVGRGYKGLDRMRSRVLTSWNGLCIFFPFLLKSVGFSGLFRLALKGVSKKSGFSIQNLKVESEWPVTIYAFSTMQELST